METKESTIEKRSAQPKLLTSKPGTKVLTNKIIKALIIKAKIPKVRMVMGKVRIIKIGLITILTKPKTIATITAVQKSATFTPGKR